MAKFLTVTVAAVITGGAFGKTDKERRYELARILESAAQLLRQGHDASKLVDNRGNVVGGYTVED